MKKNLTRIGFAALILLAGFVVYDFFSQPEGETAEEMNNRINQELLFGPSAEKQKLIDAQRAR